ncbi:MAG: 1,4-dihydroxy-2-naphthoate octaprenyltransferase [Candidatus Thorarchaeota archaeon]|nr:MAG: 1,4-dihydroxy-2-naphthoate octaprenyltransferase [Candidatus Thorarchaeota archaeon]
MFLMTEDESIPVQDKMNPGKFRAWLIELRVPFLTASTIPILLGSAIAWGLHSVFRLDYFLLTLIAGICLHIGANVSNDYFDHSEDLTGSDDINKEFIRPFTGGSRMIQRGFLSAREVLIGSLVFFVIGALIGIYLFLQLGIFIILLGVIGVGSGFFYTAPPFKLVTRGFGEFFIALNFGTLMVIGAYYVQYPYSVQSILLEPLLSIPFLLLQALIEPIIASLPIAFLIMGVLYINEFPDHDADRDAGKKTLVVRLGRKKASIGYSLIMFATYIFLIIGMLLGYVHLHTLLALITIPLAIKCSIVTLTNFDTIPKLVSANVGTIQNHMITGILLCIAYLMLGLMLPWEIALLLTIFIGPLFSIKLFMD